MGERQQFIGSLGFAGEKERKAALKALRGAEDVSFGEESVELYTAVEGPLRGTDPTPWIVFDIDASAPATFWLSSLGALESMASHAVMGRVTARYASEPVEEIWAARKKLGHSKNPVGKALLRLHLANPEGQAARNKALRALAKLDETHADPDLSWTLATFEMAKDPERAIKHCERALSLDPKLLRARLLLVSLRAGRLTS